MNFNLKKLILFCIWICLPLTAQVTIKTPKKLTVQPVAKKVPLAKPLAPKSIPCARPADIPFAQEFKTSNLPADLKEFYAAAWGNLYAGYLARNASTTQNSSEWLALKRQVFINNPFCEYTPLGQNPQQIQTLDICLDAVNNNYIPDCKVNIVNSYEALTKNYLAAMQNYLSSADFEKSMQVLPGSDRQATEIHKNYATIHLVKALNRLSKICSISVENDQPVTTFSGDIRDLGIIVNITNNSDRSFYITDEYSSKNPIAFLKHGLNGVNLYTAGLYQEPTTQTENSLPPCFSFFEVAPASMAPMSNDPLFTIGIYSGAQLINFLKMLPRKDPKIFDMNGCPTSEEYLANPQDQYMVLIQNPTPKTATTRNLDQRIQAINLSVLTGPYLLTMQINETIDTQINPTTKQPINTKILQPALTTVQVIQKPTQKTTTTATSMQQGISNAASSTTSSESTSTPEQAIATTLDTSLLPLIILPDYLWSITNLQLFWMLYSTSYVAALTDFSCFGAGNFGNAFEYFDNLGYFSTDNEYRFIIDRYNLLQVGQTLFDASWLLECALYESSLEFCSDIPGIYSAQNSKGQMVANASTFYNTNLQVALTPQLTQKPDQTVFNKINFNEAFNMPYHQIWTLIFSISTADLKTSAFLEIEEVKSKLYKFTWTNKKNETLGSQTIRIDFLTKNLFINFLTDSKNWTGSTINLILNPENSIQNKSFKIIYFSSEENTHSIVATPLLSIDKIETIHTVEFEKYPLSNLYMDLYHTVNVAPYSRFYLFQNNNQSDFLQSITQQDWQNGIYLIPSIEYTQKTSSLNKFTLSVTFYKSDKKTILGTISNSVSTSEPISGYNLGSDQFNATILEAYITTGMLLKYQEPN